MGCLMPSHTSYWELLASSEDADGIETDNNGSASCFCSALEAVCHEERVKLHRPMKHIIHHERFSGVGLDAFEGEIVYFRQRTKQRSTRSDMTE